jgi:glutamine synthetase adenylyltransferase
MNFNQVLSQLISQRNRLDTAIAALQQLSNENPSATRTALRSFDGRRRRRHMSPEAKRRISEMMKKRWAERKRAMAKTA